MSDRKIKDAETAQIGAPDEEGLPDHHGWISVGAILSMLMAAIIIPALVFVSILVQRNDQAQQQMVTQLAEATAGSIAEAVDSKFAGMLTTLRVLSTSPAMGEDELPDFHRWAARALTDTGAFLILVDSETNQLLNTRVPFGTPLGRTSDPEAVSRAIDTGEATFSNAFFGQTARRWVFNVVQPMPHAPDPAAALIMTRNADDMTDLLASHYLRGGWNAMLLDREGIVVASSFMSSDVGTPFFLTNGQEPATATVSSQVEHEGRTYELVRARSSLSDWQVVVWAPADMVRAPLTQTLRTLALGGLAIIAIGTILAWVLGRQIAKPVRRLAQDARRLGAGEPVEAVDYPVAEINAVSLALAQASRDRLAAENEIRFLMREVAHRSKNQLTVVSSIAKQTARHARTFAAFQDSFQKRVQGLARSTDLLIAGGVAGVELRELLDAQIEPFRPSEASRLEIEGPQFRLSNQAAQTLGLAIHELATNAAKYGAFSTSEGRLAVSWKSVDDKLELVWREHVPRMRRRGQTRGFGTEVIERMLGGALAAEIDRTMHRNGLEYNFTMPLERLQPDLAEAAESTAGH